ncbi:MAG: hypothetical protein J6334_11990 [Kiritimatiellae bacterium]|nr:hypothetical protein [Kiritimatiellia bacterium]
MMRINTWMFGLAMVAAVQAWAKVAVMETVHPTRDLVVAEERFVQAEQAETDVSDALQQALDRIGRAGGGTLFLPAGSYTLAKPVTVRQGVTLRGDYSFERPAASTILRITANKGEEDGPAALSIERGAGAVGLVFWYPEQTLEAPTPYPWTIRTANMPANDNQSVIDCTLVNAWRGISIGPESNELHTFRRLKICALKTGLFVDSTTDIGRICGVTVSPEVWSNSGLPRSPAQPDLIRYLMSHETTGADYGRSDWEFIWKLAVDHYRCGIRFQKGARGTSNAVMGDCDLLDCGTALEVNDLNQVGLALYNCRLSGSTASVVMTRLFTSIVQFHSCTLTDGDIQVDGPGIASFQTCSIAKRIAVNHAGQLLMQDTAVPAIHLGPMTRRLRIVGHDPEKTVIENQATACDFLTERQSPLAKRHDLVLPEQMIFPRPRSKRLLSVADFNASPSLDDNAAAFQAALDAAGREADGATVYVPAGYYHFRSNISVPSGVELRGCSDVPHHTISGGAVLMIHHGANEEEGAPFVSLQPGSGLRGLCFWYPEQPVAEAIPYPWTIRSMGKGCWMVDVNVGNAWQAADFATHPSDGHRISYFSGAMFRRGLFVGNCETRGWVEDVMFNPHYAIRVPNRFPRRTWRARPGNPQENNVIQQQRKQLEGIVFRDCRDEQIRGTFLYAAHDGIAFYGKTHAKMLIHGTDTGSRCVVLETAPESTLACALTQLVPLSDWVEAAIVQLPEDRGTSLFLATQFWANAPTALLRGTGKIRLEQLNSLSGPIRIENGAPELLNASFEPPLPAHVTVTGGEPRIIGCSSERGTFHVNGQASLLANSQELPPRKK